MDDLIPAAIILRERELNGRGEPTGWLIILAGPNREREIIAIMSCEVGLEYARAFARLLANKYRLEDIVEELPSNPPSPLGIKFGHELGLPNLAYNHNWTSHS